MSALRDEIRAILREELAAVIAEQSAGQTQSVRIETSEDLNAFARDLVDQLSKPKFAGKIKSGEVRFVLERAAPLDPVPPAIPARQATAARPPVPILDKKLITEADLAQLASGTLRVPMHACITPLAKDEAARRGVRIERTET